MTAAIMHWIWSLSDRDLSALIGITLIGLAILTAILRKIGDWT